MSIEYLLAPILTFLKCDTPQSWIDKAKKVENLPTILRDHLACELKAGQTAMHLIRKYAVTKESGKVLADWFKPYEAYLYRKEGDLTSLANQEGLSKSVFVNTNSIYSQELINKMVLLIKEELHHFYQVLQIMESRNIAFENSSAGRYAKGMMKHVTTHEPNTLIDKLICGAYIEARSCERFARIAPYLDDELQKFYLSLLRSEARHFQDYLALAEYISGTDISERVDYFGQVEAELILTRDDDFKFHSGIPSEHLI